MRHRLPSLCLAVLLAAPMAQAEEAPDLGAALAETLQYERELLEEAQALVDAAEVRDRGASGSQVSDALDGYASALVEQGLLEGAEAESAEGDDAVAERGLPGLTKPKLPRLMKPKRPRKAKAPGTNPGKPPIPLPNPATRPLDPPPGADKNGLVAVARLIAGGGNEKLIDARWRDTLKRSGKADPNALVQYVLRESHVQSARDLARQAEKVKRLNARKKELREQLAAARGKSKEQQDANEIQRLEEKLSGVGDDAQLANLDLQNKLQQQQELLQTLSSVSKKLHETAMSIIRKIG